ncbi:surface protein [Frog virus 3]|uniref:Surface protein n=1 Tax=Frog virus 3 TaxID=10493 RepID=A0A5B8P155_FRG3V|nr:surface protein [Frog virus 3]
MTLPDVSGSLGPLSPGTNGTLWAVGPRVVRYQIPALAYLTPGALWTLRTRGTSLTSGPHWDPRLHPDPSRRPLRCLDPGATRATRATRAHVPTGTVCASMSAPNR